MKKILITAGPTREPMDPVRYLTNPSSGQMGLLLAQELRRSGFRPIVILGPTSLTCPRGIKIVPVTTAIQMRREVMKKIKGSDVFIAAAAVSDFRFKSVSSQKFKKRRNCSMTVELIPNPDILWEVGERKKRLKMDRPVLVGFALETRKIHESMKKKLKDKNLDLIIGNEPSSFARAMIKARWLERNGQVKNLNIMTKRNLAKKIVHWIESYGN